MYGSFNFNHARGWEMTMRQKLTMCVVEFLAHFHVRVRECARTGTFLLLTGNPKNKWWRLNEENPKIKFRETLEKVKPVVSVQEWWEERGTTI